VLLLDLLEDGADAFLHGELSVRVGTLARGSVELQRLADVPLVFDLAENNLQEFEEGRLFLHSVRDVDVIMAGLEDEEEVVFYGVLKGAAFRAVDIFKASVC